MCKMKIKEIKERRVSLHEEMKELHKAETFDTEKYDKLEKEFNTLSSELARAEKLEQIDLEFASNKPEHQQEKEYNSKDDINEAYRQLIVGGGDIKNVKEQLRSNIIANNANGTRANVQSTAVALGGYTIPEGFSEMLEKAALFYSNIPSIAKTITTPTGNDYPWPTTNDSANVAYQVSEAANLETSAAAAPFAETIFKSYKWHTGLIRLNFELLQDSFFDMKSVMADLFGERKGRGENAAMSTGAGTTTISGVVTGAADSGVVAAATGAVTRDEILDAIHSVDISYRRSPNFYIMFSDATLAAIRKLDYGTADARPLYQPSAIAGAPDTIDGVKVFINNDIADMAASAKAIIIGDFSQYKIRRVAGLRFKVLNEVFAATDQIGMDLLWRWDAQVLNAGTNPIKYLTMAAS